MYARMSEREISDSDLDNLMPFMQEGTDMLVLHTNTEICDFRSPCLTILVAKACDSATLAYHH